MCIVSGRMSKCGISLLGSVYLSLLQCTVIPVLQLVILIRRDEGKREREREREEEGEDNGGTLFHRLVTAGMNGEIKIWNFNNGHCLVTLDKGSHFWCTCIIISTSYIFNSLIGNDEEVCDVKFVSVNQIK